ncbi:molybdenum cofactor guanylyltransferase [Halobacillus sp. Marseille-Q1614]|uniref:molybdenum cofactor guanylyltransferase n=1 Tax=Halobacillus sp. Marseille-Q1614 TaxID=2709134 RepID=UPI0015704ACC|nr:molybdenum cofactor guanylyltransferase [Halobacillus sp. Marseille-Q1614]
MNDTVSGAVLAGGQSRRMGEDKALLPLGNQIVIQQVYKRMKEAVGHVVVNRAETIYGIDAVYIQDSYKDCGPLGGLHAVLQQTNSKYVVLAACDTPFVEPQVIQRLISEIDNHTEAVIPVYGGRNQPLLGIYHKTLALKAEELLRDGQRKMQSLLEQANVKYADNFKGLNKDAVYWHFFNMNTKEDYERALSYIS